MRKLLLYLFLYFITYTISFINYYHTTDWYAGNQWMVTPFTIMVSLAVTGLAFLWLIFLRFMLKDKTLSQTVMLILLMSGTFLINEYVNYEVRNSVPFFGLFDEKNNNTFHGESILISSCSVFSILVVVIISIVRDLISKKKQA